MESNPPKPNPGPGQRSLAAIVFTDVVSFSARMQTDEETTLRLLARDFAAMRRMCTGHGGTVLKTTGDGLLLYFSSAVQAVACALAIQRYFAAEGKTRPAAEMLIHRVGIHLGDVFVNDQDVMGDGVNIAARLQAEAAPGGICISQTVYDVVKNKLALHVVRLGPRELKNISQHIPIYRLLLEAQAIGTAEEAPPAEEPAAAGVRRPLGRLVKLAGGAALVVGLAGLIALAIRTQMQRQAEQARAEAAQAEFNARLADDNGGADRVFLEKMPRVLTAWREELRASRSRAAEEYNFAELARDLRDPRAGPVAKADAPVRQQALERIQRLLDWLGTAMQRYTREQPLIVRELSGTAPKEIRMFAGLDRRLYYAEGGAVRQRNWTERRPPVLAAIIAGAMIDARPVPAREVVQGAQAFAWFYGLPELTEALRTGHLRRGQE
ncbi:MAG: adenylate/guanylate cyclase domain-containing protein [Opitutae bacterium]|nr:adenylate/guanylate cyclase domain-containing protein [Opitutae bacterium]